MKTKSYSAVTVLICSIVLLVVAAMSFISMNYFDRSIFDGYRPVLLSFALLAGSFLFAAFLKRPLLVFPFCAAAAAGIWFVTPIYAGLFFPVFLQAVMYDACRNEKKGDLAVYTVALLCGLISFRLWFYCKSYDDFQLSAYTENEFRLEKYLYLAGLGALLVVYLFFAVRLFLTHKTYSDSTPAGNSSRNKNGRPLHNSSRKKKTLTRRQNAAVALRCAFVFLLSAVNAAAELVYSSLFLKAEYCKVLFYAQILFLLFLEFRAEPMFRLHKKTDAFFAAIQQMAAEGTEQTGTSANG